MKNPTFKEVCSTKDARVEYGNPPYVRWLHNSNKLLGSYQGIIGVKTGFTDKAKRCLVSACELNGVTLICVTLNSPSDWNDHIDLYNFGYSALKKVEIPIDNENMLLNVVGGKRELAYVKQQESAKLTLYSEDISKIQKRIILPKFEYAPLNKGDIVGRAEYLLNGEVIQSIPIIVDEDVDELYIKPKPTIKEMFKKVFDKFKKHKGWEINWKK